MSRAGLEPREQDDAGRWIKYLIYIVREEQIDRPALDCRARVGGHVRNEAPEPKGRSRSSIYQPSGVFHSQLWILPISPLWCQV